MLAMMMVVALSFTSCGDDDNGGSGINQTSNKLKMVSSNGKTYNLFDRGINNSANLSPNGHIWCYMQNDKGNVGSFRIVLGSVKSISDFPVGYNLGKLNMNYDDVSGDYNHYNQYNYSSGSISVIANDGKSFTLKFDNYVAKHKDGKTMTVNGTLYVEDEKFY